LHSISSRRRRTSAGQSVTEFALTLPLLLVMFVAVADLARAYATMVAIESAAREAADWAAFQSSNWIGDPADPASNEAKTIEGMTQRACTAASTVPDYAEPPGTIDHATCTNPTLSYELILAVGDGENCADPVNEPPCQVKVTLQHTFTLILPFSIPIIGGQVGFPSEISFERDSVFALSDLQVPD